MDLRSRGSMLSRRPTALSSSPVEHHYRLLLRLADHLLDHHPHRPISIGQALAPVAPGGCVPARHADSGSRTAKEELVAKERAIIIFFARPVVPKGLWWLRSM